MGERATRASAPRRVGEAGLRLLAVAVVAAWLTSCSGASSAHPGGADEEFLSMVHTGAADISGYRSDIQLVRIGHAACDGLSSGASYVQLADRLALQEGPHQLPAEDLGAVIRAAVVAYCPRYESLVS